MNARNTVADIICHALKQLGIGHARITRGISLPIIIRTGEAAIAIDLDGNVLLAMQAIEDRDGIAR